MDLGLQDRTAIVTGASRGIGKYIAQALAREGCDVAICARTASDLDEAAAEVREEGAEVLALPMDVTEAGEPERLVEETYDRFGRIDTYVGNVGGNRRGSFEELSDEDWEDLMDLNFMSHVRVSRAAVPHMREVEGASICYISSIFGRELGGAGLSLYNTTKSALISVSKVMAQDLAPEIRVNSVAPGSIRFPGGSWDRRVKENPEEMEQFVEENIAIERFGRATEVADAVTFLCSERASLITGACINVDGGQSQSLI
ncbi:3-oxoacyl-[acyl-carrier protein] reductase [Salinibacter ruber]|jgi:3-oxoacyl-[acyl-carrier protein] reductase|uniref:Oxidoreductase, short chain dehydrogenase/reductase family n=3 Tax=Salinibacter ruber TaxID=146919 RepID=Q2S4K7_SALRD|nr:glucose 1-dehydrogenase [Salinibacter ruber]ABC46084.1 oxidoreductase, short chain dehydrogenase/reductase family [Salinibacter ruber DSM 13855]MBB4061999.1 3-oxoacyl-[acyl-carrier protein] reductase [Salinibacter ruber]MBB4067577.1 3-oxoacyl-[acyl-carrier protein] reductase [Salinibacter ruber]MBB4090540.1 3-oxoacyl-[acyl-carrier protein] reductase [Salinibacter ruber]MCS3611381.1 3-oxoacyl-[acyl-carrier protein] reductase [Salinibacter ruber]